jgi:hypothetical protein
MVTQKTQMKVALTTGVAAEWYVHAIADDGKLTFEDMDETVVAAGILAGIWQEELFGLAGWTLRLPLGTMALAATMTVMAGTIPAYLIGGREGVDTYLEFVTSGPEAMIEKTLEETIPTLYPRVIQELFEAKVYAEKKVIGFWNWAERHIEEGIEEAERRLWNPLPKFW